MVIKTENSECVCVIKINIYIYIYIYERERGALSVMVTAVGNGHSEPSSNSRRGCLHFPQSANTLGEKYVSNYE